MFPARHFLAIGAFSLLAILPACTEKLAKQTGLTAQDLYTRGQQKSAAGKPGAAGEAFQVLLERFPNSPLAAKAQLGLADARMENKEDLEAEVAFDDFIRLYPANDNISYALYRKGELLARQVPDTGRDQSKTVEAVKAFTLAREKNPNGPYAEKAAAKIGRLRNRLAEHESNVASHYLRRRNYESAEVRARRAVSDYPDTTATPLLMSILAKAVEKQGRKEEAGEIRGTLAEKFPSGGGKKP
ncbi:MAG: outer membrane protein assembly factor BamD [Deltaproteobacteria bacterium]|nr:outer membrane protein assembly factor BamD [Deltaproteobacteria bacterium]